MLQFQRSTGLQPPSNLAEIGSAEGKSCLSFFPLVCLGGDQCHLPLLSDPGADEVGDLAVALVAGGVEGDQAGEKSLVGERLGGHRSAEIGSAIEVRR